MRSHAASAKGATLAAALLLVAFASGCSQSRTKAERTPGVRGVRGAPGEQVEPIDNPLSAGTLAATVTKNPTLPPDPFTSETASSYWRSGRGSNADFPSTYAGVIGAGERANRPGELLPGAIDNPTLPDQPMRPANDGVENLRQVTFAHEGADFDPVVSRDGSTIFFASTAHSSTSDIFSKSVDGRALTQLTTDPANDAMPAISPDSTRVAFASNRSGNWDIYVMSATGGQAVQITSDGAQELHPTWSPDGSMIAYCRLSDTSGRWEIWLTEVDKPAVRRFLTPGLFPDWHPTENRILFQRPRERGDRYFSIWTVDYVNGDAMSPTLIASSATAAIINPRWSHDGTYIACATVSAPAQGNPTGRPEKSDIWIMRPDGSARANLTGGRNVNLMPAWGPDNTVFFVTDRSGSDNIWATSGQQAIIAAGHAPPNLPVLTGAGDAKRPAPTTATAMPKPAIPVWPRSTNPSSHADVPPEMANVPTDISDNH